MNYLKSLYSGVWGALLLLSCTDAEDTIGLKDSTAGAYVTVLSVASSSFDVKHMDAAYFELTVRAWDEQHGGLLQSFNFSVKLLDNTTVNGTTETVVTAVKSIPASAFSPDKTTGLPSATIRITAAEALEVLGITASDVAKGDVFQFLEELVLTDGRRFNDPNTAVEVGSSAFYKSPFYHNVTVVDN